MQLTAARASETSAGCPREASAGDSFASGIVVALPRLKHYALSLTRDSSAADDLVQETLARAIEKNHLWQAGTDLRAWLFTLMHNLHINTIRRTVREAEMIKTFRTGAFVAAPPTQTLWHELRDLQRGLAMLPDEQRSAVLQVGLNSGGYKSIALLLGIPIGTLRSRLSRGRASLRASTGRGPCTTRATPAAGRPGGWPIHIKAVSSGIASAAIVDLGIASPGSIDPEEAPTSGRFRTG
jgi:RNA polymerase sigma-70 factor, ECF subfamily